jgi:hypothetical protein
MYLRRLFLAAAEPGAVAAGALGLAVLLTSPLAFTLGRVARVDSGDGQFAIWNVAWVARTIVADPGQLYDANIFYPVRNALAFSEANLGAGLLAVPAYWLTRDAIIAHTVVVILSFALAAAVTYALARYLRADRPAAAVAAISFAFAPFVVSHLAHIQLLMTFGLPLELLALHRFADRPTPGRAAVLGMAIALTALFCAYYGVFGGLAVGLGVLYYAWTRDLWPRWQYWTLAIGAAALAAALVWPFFSPYLEIQAEGFGRSLDESRRYSANLASYGTSGLRIHAWLLPAAAGWKEVLFPGVVAPGFAAAGLWLARRRSPETEPTERETARFYGLLGILSIWTSFGPQAGLYRILYEAVPVFGFLRAPSRIGILVMLAIAMLAALGTSRLIRRTPPAWRVRAAAALVTLAVADRWTVPVRWPRVGAFPPAYELLARLPKGAVAEFPFFADSFELHHHSRYMLYSTVHWQPLVNGYSDHWPRGFRADASALKSFPSAEALATLDRLGVRYLVFHLTRFPPEHRQQITRALARLRNAGRARPLLWQDAVWLYELVPARRALSLSQGRRSAVEGLAPAQKVGRSAGQREEHHEGRTEQRDRQAGLDRQAQACEVEGERRLADAEAVQRDRHHLHDEADRHDDGEMHG